ncbi:transglutaminase domain-containing protein [Alicyclobacillus acidiphilus]|uniref:transglutaminase domain-containing protein n=1 Tax=Alicyclobacillus acidiphilus TaxID=182455 RepID=UPI0009FB1C3E
MAANVHTTDDKAITPATIRWVKTHVRSANQTQTARADQTLAKGSSNQASRTALVVALLRANNIPAKEIGKTVSDSGYFVTP